MVDVFYSLVDVNKRFNRLIFDPLYIFNFDLTVKSSFNHISSINNQILSRICSKIVPRIHSHVNKISLPRLRELTIEYERLTIVTNNFTNDATRLNCTNLQNIHIEGVFVLPENFHQYFPLL